MATNRLIKNLGVRKGSRGRPRLQAIAEAAGRTKPQRHGRIVSVSTWEIDFWEQPMAGSGTGESGRILLEPPEEGRPVRVSRIIRCCS